MGRTGGLRRLLVIGDTSASTGFGRVVRAVLGELRDEYDIHQLGVNLWTETHDLPWPAYPTDPIGDKLGTKRLASLVQEVDPDLVLCVTDLWVHPDYLEVLAPHRSRFGIVLYTPIDGTPIDPELMAPLAGVESLVVYTEFAREACERGAAELRVQRPDVDMPAVTVIPHGVDTTAFHPLGADRTRPPTGEERQSVIDDLYGVRPDFQDAFIVLNANRNQPRKRIDVTMKAFALFARDKPPNVKLHLHMGSEDLGWHLPRLGRRLGILDRLILTNRNVSLPTVPDALLNRIYNSAAVGLNTSTGEGWGLVAFEHAATGAAQVMPAHTACRELWDGSATLVEPALTLTMEGPLTEAGYVHPADVAAALQRLYEDPGRLETSRAACFATAHRAEYRWDDIGDQWRHLLRRIASTIAPS